MQRLSKFMANMSGGKSKGGAGHRAEKEREGDRGGGGDGNGKGDDRGYDGKVDKNINHRMTMPAAWRVDDYLDGSDDDDLSVLR